MKRGRLTQPEQAETNPPRRQTRSSGLTGTDTSTSTDASTIAVSAVDTASIAAHLAAAVQRRARMNASPPPVAASAAGGLGRSFIGGPATVPAAPAASSAASSAAAATAAPATASTAATNPFSDLWATRVASGPLALILPSLGSAATRCEALLKQYLHTSALAKADDDATGRVSRSSGGAAASASAATAAPASAAVASPYAKSLSSLAKDALAAAAEFNTAQMARQAVDVGTNTRKQDTPEAAAAVVSSQRAALDLLLSSTGPLTPRLLCRVHAVLTRGTPGSGRLRTVTARCGSRVFCGPAFVGPRLDNLVTQINGLASRPDVGAFGLAAFAAVGLVELHPFADGNGRLSRALANWALRRAGLPFPIALCATQGQRSDYIAASLSSCCDGATPTATPFADLLAAHTSRAWDELDRVRQGRADAAARGADTAAVLAAREEQRRLPCLICLDDKPDVATLCCSAPVHLNCIAEWLSSAGDAACVQCRAPLPRPPPRPAAAAAAAINVNVIGEGEEEDTETTTTGEDGASSDSASSDSYHGAAVIAAVTAASAAVSAALAVVTSANYNNLHLNNNTNQGQEEEDTETTTTAPVGADGASSNSVSSDSYHGNAGSGGGEEETENDTTAVEDTQAGAAAPAAAPVMQQHQRLRCALGCANTAAGGCSNYACGRCCMLRGHSACHRHGIQ